MASRWLLKTEPKTYAFEDLVREGRTAWDGVRNNLALQHMRKMRPGDEVFVYHTGSVKAVVGTAQVVGEPYPDPGADHERFVAVDLVPGAPLARPVTLAELKAEPTLAAWELLTMSRLSAMPVPAAAWRKVNALARRSG